MLCRGGPETRINVLLATLSPLLQSTRHNVSEVLPHAAKDSTSCATTGRTRAPHTLLRKLLETIATLCSLHDVCTSAAVTLEVASDRATLFISTDDTAPKQLIQDVESWVASLRAIAEDWASDADPPDGSFSVEEHSEAVLMANVYRACYATIRARIRADGGLTPTLRKLSDELPLEKQAVDDPDTPLGKLCTNLELLVSCTDPETVEENDETHLAAACIAGWAADQALRQDWVLCRIVDGIDNRAIQVIREACAVSALVDTLVTIAKCGGMSLALPLFWAVEWVSPPSISIPISSSSEAVSTPDDRAGQTQHPESYLIRHIIDNALSVHPYIATSALPCYPCVMLMRSVNLAQSPFTQSGTGCDYMLRGCDAGIVSPWLFPWVGCEEDFEHAEDILRELELGLERDLQLLQDRRPGATLGDVSTLVRGLLEKPIKRDPGSPPRYVECAVLATSTL